MDSILQTLMDLNWWSVTIRMIDGILFTLYLIAVSYLFIFAIGSNIRRERKVAKARRELRYAIIIFLDHRDTNIQQTIDSFRSQDYPQDKYEIIVVSNNHHSATNQLLLEQSVRVIIAPTERYSQSLAVKHAMANLDGTEFDAVILMTDNSIVEPCFIKDLNNIHSVSRGKVIQTHRRSQKLETDTALFGAVSEEINNSIFRQGHVNLGFSSALIGSGMLFNFSWLKNNIQKTTDGDIEKQLEELILSQSIFIDYISNIVVYSQKADKASDFYKERKAWFSTGVTSVKIILHKLPSAIIRGNIDYCNKLLQWLIPSRTILIGTLLMIVVSLLIFSWTMALKWVIMLIMLIVAFSIALPDYFIDTRFIKALRGAPLMFLLTVINTIKSKTSKR